MQKHILSFTALLLLVLSVSCGGAQEPEIRRFENVRTTKVTASEIVIVADMVGFNPNPVGGTVSETDVTVTVNEVEAAAVIQDQDAEIPGNAEFTIPLVCTISPRRLFEDDRDGLIGGLLNAALKREVNVHYTGDLKFILAGITFEEPVDYVEVIKIK